MTDPDYGDWDVYEPTEQELLAPAIQDDADPDCGLHALQYRQDQRWSEFFERVNARIGRTGEAIESAFRPSQHPGPSWYKLWQPPRLDAPDLHPGQLIHSGMLSFNTESKYDDHFSYGSELITRSLAAETTWMDFEPALQHGIPHWDVLRYLSADGRTIQSSDMHGDWGWWDDAKRRFRSKVWGVRVWASEQDPTFLTDLAVLVRQPPPYGMWLPILDLQNQWTY
jgi:hypothetical protein